jgi:hypothetical protein
MTRQRGFIRYRPGDRDARLSPVGGPVPECPSPEHKPAVACWLWNPLYGELWWEASGTTVRDALVAFWTQCETFAEARAGKQPVIHVAGRAQRSYPEFGTSYWAPILKLLGWVDRDLVPAFAQRAPTVVPPKQLPDHVRSLLEGPVAQPALKKVGGTIVGAAHTRVKRIAAEVIKPKPDGLEEYLDDSLPDHLR